MSQGAAGLCSVSPRAFEAIQRMDVSRLAALSGPELRPLLPCLVRAALCAPADLSPAWAEDRKRILRLLSGEEAVNPIVALLSVDFRALEQDARTELQLGPQAGGGSRRERSVLVSQRQDAFNRERSLALEFEHSDPLGRLRLTLRKLLAAMSSDFEEQEFPLRSSELFESGVYAEEVAHTLCVLQAELPSLLPVVEVALALLRVGDSERFLCWLVANIPSSFDPVCRALVKSGGERTDQALRRLCQMNPSQAFQVRSMLAEQGSLLGLALTLDHQQKDHREAISPLVSYVSSLLLGANATVPAWFSALVHREQQAGEGEVLRQMRTQLLTELTELLPGRGPSDTENISGFAEELGEERTVAASALLRLYCTLVGGAGLRPTDEEAGQLLRLMGSRAPDTPSGVHLASLSLCTLLACPALLDSAQREQQVTEQLMAPWLSWASKEEDRLTPSATGVPASFREMLLLVAMYFHSNRLSSVVELACSTLGMRLAVKPGSLTRMKTIFTQMFTEQVVTALATRVAVTKQLSANVQGFLPVHCVYQLLRSQAFSMHGVSIKDWLYRQLCETTTPLHPQLLPLIDAYISSVLAPASQAASQPITEQELLQVFQRRGQEAYSLTAQLLMLYYVLTYEESLLALACVQRRPRGYSAALLEQIPIMLLVSRAHGLQQELGVLHSALLRLLVSSYPHLCQAEAWLWQEETTGTLPLLRGTMLAGSVSQSQLRQAFQELPSSSSRLLRLLERLALLSPAELMPYAQPLTHSLALLLEPAVPRRVLQTLKQLWLALSTVMPCRLWVMTVNALQPPAFAADLGRRTYVQKELVLDPLAVLRCDQRVSRCPPLMDVLLHALDGFLLASGAYLHCHLQERRQGSADPGLRGQSAMAPEEEATPPDEEEHHRKALLALQESAAVQLLLEVCLPTSQEQHLLQSMSSPPGSSEKSLLQSMRPPAPRKTGRRGEEEEEVGGGEMETEAEVEGGLLGDLREVQALVMRRLHRVFLADPNVAKLVHFQGYPPALLPLTTGGAVPSIHICLDFIPELLLQPDLEKRIFGVRLLSHLCARFRLPKAMDVAREAVGVMGTLLARLPRVKRVAFFTPTLPCLVVFCQVFPPLRANAVALLVQVATVCAAVVASRGGAGGLDPVVKRLQRLKDTPPKEVLLPGGGACLKPGGPQRGDPDVQLCYCVEETFLNITSLHPI